MPPPGGAPAGQDNLVVHREQLDEREREAWLALVSEAALADPSAHAREARRGQPGPGIIVRPWRLLSGAITKIRLTMRLMKFVRRIRRYERVLGAKYAPSGLAGGTGRVTLIGFAGWEALRELELRASEEVQRSVDQMTNV